MRASIFRFQADVGASEFIRVEGPVVKVALVSPDQVEFWVVASGTSPEPREFTIVGTGHGFDTELWDYRGTAERCPQTGLVWHLLERR